ncbi:type III secretion system inner membrane ring subunit SctD [Pseudomonas sp. RTC3]|uniref:type III secretion system inner membrane ring subunit SctD n=1 Tax=Pseudomonas sp. 5C2 TaxID=3048588 RepID=UPI002AB494BA|nr:type III secretion system inner membrane ring subunit SctD [Pseudomonas sp. 5C2]MDY7564696.1 type III secretion system inner membrane ring subunit SctD [Pseudomonas sp. 5C2]MEB0060657.1 type III secretion system inner membrane ring subunit SctD [Pseudomonas sp. RTC3]MEB0240884.1 type III secretion system inner membrane ring subunit SctD [Pseudomonas sp. 5C2]
MFELRVLSGLHQGAALPLIGEQWLIGADAAQDLALFDPGVASLHCRLQRVGEGWTLNAEDGVVCDEQGHAHPVTALTLNRNFTLGSVWLCLAAAEDAWPAVPALNAANPQNDTQAPPSPDAPQRAKATTRSRVFNRVSGVIIGLLVGIVGSAWSLTRAPTSVIEPVATSDAKTMVPSGKRIPLENAEDARRQLSTMLSERMLNDVSVQQTPEGMTVSGNLKEESLLVYQRMLQRFKDRFDSPVALIDNVSTSSTGLPFVIVQIMSGPHAHLVTADGHRLYIGDELQGLRLTRIDDQRIEFDGDRHYELRW